MKTITVQQRQRLEDLSAEGLLNLPTAIAEKNIHVTDLLKALSEIVIQHDGFQDLDTRRETARIDTEVVLVFASGTCLSKAHRLMDGRMSEDIDIKVVLNPPATPLRKALVTRFRRKVIHDSVLKVFEQLDLKLTANGRKKSTYTGFTPLLPRRCGVSSRLQPTYKPAT